MFQAGLLVGLVCREQAVGVTATMMPPFPIPPGSGMTIEAADDIRSASESVGKR